MKFSGWFFCYPFWWHGFHQYQELKKWSSAYKISNTLLCDYRVRVLDFIISSAGQLQQLVIIASASMLFIYLDVVLATIKLRFKTVVSEERSFKIPGGIIVPVLAAGIIIWLLAHLGGKEFLYSGIFIAVLCLVYFAMKMIRKN